MDHQQIPYSNEFQEKILCCIVRMPEFLQSIRNVLLPTHFEVEMYSNMCRIVLRFYDQYGRLPLKDELDAEITDKINNAADNASFLILSDLSTKIYNAKIADYRNIIDKTRAFFKRQALKAALMEAIDCIEENKDLDEIRSKIERASDVGEEKQKEFEFYKHSSELDNIISSSIYSKRGVPTFFSALDERLYGGLMPGEVGVIYAATNVGKSMVLVNFAYAASFSGYDVVYFTIGDMDACDVLVRLCARTAKVEIGDILQNTKKYADFFKQIRGKVVKSGKGRIHIKPYYSKRARASDIRSYVSSLIAQNKCKPGLIIVDYADEMIPSKGQGSTYADMGWIYSELKCVAGELNCALWTASQITREGYRNSKDKDVDVDSASDSWLKSTKADVVLGLAQNKDEESLGLIRYNLAKARRARKGLTRKLKVESAKMLVQEQEEGSNEIIENYEELSNDTI